MKKFTLLFLLLGLFLTSKAQSDDVGIDSICIPNNVNHSFEANVRVKNFGGTDVDSFNVCYNHRLVTKCLLFTKADFGIAPTAVLDTITITLDTIISGIGLNVFTAWTELGSDSNRTNDTLSKTYFGMINSSKEINSEKNIAVYPQPATNTLYIEGEIGKYSASIIDINGRLINSKESLNGFQNSFDISKLKSGVYFLRIQSENGVISRKFIKE